MLLDWCVGKAASGVKKFYLLPVGGKLIQYDALAVNTIVKNKRGEVRSTTRRWTAHTRGGFLRACRTQSMEYNIRKE